MENEKRVLIVEKTQDSLIKESTQNSNKFLLNGIFTEFDIENRNKRFYKAENFIPCMNALLEKRKMLGVLFGEFDHPDVFDIAGKSTSHAIESLTHNVGSNRVDGSIALLTTHYGKEARAIINDGYPLFVSSRAAGVTDGSGNVALKELFTYDIVLDPGFASARVSVNESYGLGSSEEVRYRIYEVKDAGKVNDLFADNKNDGKTQMDLKFMEQFLADEMTKLEHKIMTQLENKKVSPEETKSLMEKYEIVNEELTAVKGYLDFFKSKVTYLIGENSKIVADNQKLNFEINENTAYSNHLASQLKNLNKYATGIENRLKVDEQMIEYVAEHAKANILFTEDVANNITKLNETVANNAEFLEYVATETEVTQRFAEQVAAETDITQKFAEQVAAETEIAQKFTERLAQDASKEIKDTQGFLEYVANEKYKDEVFLNYVAEKVDGIIGYSAKAIDRIKASVPVSESASTEDSIHGLENIVEFLGIENEQEVANNIENVQDVKNAEGVQEVQPEAKDVQDAQVQEVQPTVLTPMTVPPAQPIAAANADATNTEIQVQDDDAQVENSILSALVKIIATDGTGIVMSVDPETGLITIQHSGTDDCAEYGRDQIEVINTDENIAQKVEDVLLEVKKQKILNNQQPHFFNFLSEQQVSDFKNLDTASRDAVTLALNESTYFNTADVLNVIGSTLNQKAMSYEERIIKNMPETVRGSWNGMTQEQKVSLIAESKYFSLITNADITNFWNTRPFAKAVNSPEATLIKESAQVSDESLNDDYVNAFLKSMDSFNTK